MELAVLTPTSTRDLNYLQLGTHGLRSLILWFQFVPIHDPARPTGRSNDANMVVFGCLLHSRDIFMSALLFGTSWARTQVPESLCLLSLMHVPKLSAVRDVQCSFVVSPGIETLRCCMAMQVAKTLNPKS